MFNLPISVLKNIPNSSLYAFISESNKSVYLCHSTCSIIEIAKHLDELYKGVHKSSELQSMYNDVNGDLELRIIKAYDPDVLPVIVRAEYGVVIDDLVKGGYRNMRPEYSAGEFKLKSKVTTIVPWGRFMYMVVYAESKRRERIVLGVFNSVSEGKDWIDQNYVSNDRIVPIFAKNDLTLRFHKELGLKIEL